jgi:hypothetical protein
MIRDTYVFLESTTASSPPSAIPWHGHPRPCSLCVAWASPPMFFVCGMGLPAHVLCLWHGRPRPCSLRVAWASLPMFVVRSMGIAAHVLCVWHGRPRLCSLRVAWASLPMFHVRSMGIAAHVLCVWHGHPCPCSLCVAWASLPMFLVCSMGIPAHAFSHHGLPAPVHGQDFGELSRVDAHATRSWRPTSSLVPLLRRTSSGTPPIVCANER